MMRMTKARAIEVLRKGIFAAARREPIEARPNTERIEAIRKQRPSVEPSVPAAEIVKGFDALANKLAPDDTTGRMRIAAARLAFEKANGLHA